MILKHILNILEEYGKTKKIKIKSKIKIKETKEKWNPTKGYKGQKKKQKINKTKIGKKLFINMNMK